MKQFTIVRIELLSSQISCIESEKDLMILFSLHNRTFQKTYQTGVV